MCNHQMTLDFEQPARKQSFAPMPLVVLDKTDLAYRQSIIDGNLEFPEPFLKETRAQRIGCSVHELECMFSYERARELADEAILMRMTSWQFERPVWIDWELINHRAKQESIERALDFAEYRRLKDAGVEFSSDHQSTKHRKGRGR